MKQSIQYHQLFCSKGCDIYIIYTSYNCMKQRWEEETDVISLLGLVAPVSKHFSSQSYLSVPQAPSVKKDKAVDKNSISKSNVKMHC